MLLSQLKLPDGGRAVAVREGDTARLVPGVSSTVQLAQAAIDAGRSLAAEIAARGQGDAVDLAAALAEGAAPLFRMRARQAYEHAEDERGRARMAMVGRTSDLAQSLRDRFLGPRLRRGEGPEDAASPSGGTAADVDPADGPGRT